MRNRGDKPMTALTLLPSATTFCADAAAVDKRAGLRQLTPARRVFRPAAPRFA